MGSATEKAYTTIRSKIGAGAYSPGTRLTEAELVALCRVSRTPVREALRQLARDGLVQIKPRVGAVVAGWEPNDLGDLFAARAELEALAAARAAERATGADLDRIEAKAAAMEAYAAEHDGPVDRTRLTELNSAFHNAILEAAKSEPLNLALGSVIEAPLMLHTFQRYDQRQLERSLAHHREIVDALRARDPAWTSAVMRTHILAGFRALAGAEPRPDGERS
mgnify:FL=1